MTLDKHSSTKIGLTLGMALGLVVTGIGILRYKTGMILRNDQSLSYVYWILFALSVFFAVYRFSKFQGPSFSLRQTIKIGLFAGLYSGAFYTGYIVILNTYIAPDLAANIVRYYAQELASNSSELSNEDLADSMTITQLNPAVRGTIYTVVCIAFGILYATLSTFLLKRLRSVRVEQSSTSLNDRT